MFKYYLRIAGRSLWHHKFYTLINVIGLVIGMTICILIYLYVSFEMSYDKFNSNENHIYRIVCDTKTPSGTTRSFFTSSPMAPAIKDDLPEVQSFVRLSTNSILITKDNFKYQEENTLFADSSLFSIFDFPLLKGNPSTALKEAFSIVLSETASKKYFGSSDPVGQTVLMTGWRVPAKITGVMKDIPENSQIKADMLVSMTTITESWDTASDHQWDNLNDVSYLLLKPGTNVAHLQAKFPALLEDHYGADMKKNRMFYNLSLEPLNKVYLHSSYGGLITGNIHNVYIFSVIALFILLIACTNFINLSTARATERAKEVGIRKLLGIGKAKLIRGFIVESLCLSLIAFVLALILSSVLLPLFNQLAGKTVVRDIFENVNTIVSLSLLAICIGILAGIYPALVLSSYKPILVLKGRFSSSNKGILVRKGLVIMQFATSIVLIIGTIIIYLQLHYMRNEDLGFDKEQTIVIITNMDPSAPDVKREVNSIPHVVSTTFSSSIPGSGDVTTMAMVENKSGEMQSSSPNLYMVDADFLKQYKITLLAGRVFSKDFGTDSAQAMILNETAVKELGYSSANEVIGKRFKQWGSQGRIIGVIKDFHDNALQVKIGPLCMRESKQLLYYLSIKVGTTDLHNTIAKIRKVWEKTIPARPFNYFFLDEFFAKHYHAEEKFGRLFLYFAILAILISCMGLLGLASYSTLQRTKEIGIRKVMGASVSDIIGLLSNDFLKLVMVAFVLASPVAWFIMYKWLQDFAYRIHIPWWTFLIAGGLAILIAIITVSLQALKAAMANPIKTLRNE